MRSEAVVTLAAAGLARASTAAAAAPRADTMRHRSGQLVR